MIEINAGVILFLLLRKRESCRISDIVKIKRIIEDKITSVFVVVDKKSVIAYVQHYNEYFAWNDGVQKIGDWRLSDIDVCIRYEFDSTPNDIRTIVYNIVDNFNNEVANV